MVELDTLFQTKTVEKHTLWRRTYPYSLYKGLRHGAKNALQIMCLAAYASETNKAKKMNSLRKIDVGAHVKLTLKVMERAFSFRKKKNFHVYTYPDCF